MKYRIKWLSFVIICIIINMCNFSNYVFTQETNLFNTNDNLNYKSNILDVNNSFTFSRLLVSTIDPLLAPNNQQHSLNNEQNSTSGLYNGFGKTTDNVSPFPKSLIENPNLQSFNSSLMNKSVTSDQSPLIDTKLNRTGNLSTNLVSMLTGIVIQSLEKGNPTINEPVNAPNGVTSQKHASIIVSGNWIMEVLDGDITNFNARFVMISSDALGFHWHSFNDLRTNKSISFGADDTVMLKGSMDYFTDDDLIVNDGNVFLTINNFELIEIIFLNNEISRHFNGLPIYGIIDSVMISN